MALNPFGIDISALPDLNFTLKTGLENLKERLLRRLLTPRGSLHYDARYGLDIRLLLNESLNSNVVYEYSVLIAGELEKDEAVQSVTATLEVVDQITLRITAAIEITDGFVELILDLHRVTAEVLHANLN